MASSTMLVHANLTIHSFGQFSLDVAKYKLEPIGKSTAEDIPPVADTSHEAYL